MIRPMWIARPWAFLAIAACTVCLAVGCPGIDEFSGDVNEPVGGPVGAEDSSAFPETEFPSTGDTVLDEVLAEIASDDELTGEVVASIEDQLEAGDEVAQVREFAVGEFLADERVAGAGVDDENGFLWVEYTSGTISSLQVFDEEEKSSTAQDGVIPATPLKLLPVFAPANKSSPRAQANSSFYPRMPANNKAYLGNAIPTLHKDDTSGSWEGSDATTLVVGAMLRERGYDVLPGELTLHELRDITNHSVILLDTHGGWSKEGIRRVPLLPQILPTEPGELDDLVSCNPQEREFFIVTSTVVSRAARDSFWGAGAAGLRSYARDRVCRRALLHTVIVRTRSSSRTTTRRVTTWGITANFIRRHATGKFPDNTLFWLNGCSGVARDGASTMRDMLFEKSGQGAYFISWQGNARNDYAIRAALNHFQLMTASNLSLNIGGFKALEKASPPRGGAFTGIQAAFAALVERGYHLERRAAGDVILYMLPQNSDQRDLILMPILWAYGIDYDIRLATPRDLLTCVAEGEPLVRIGDSTVSVLNRLTAFTWESSAPVGALGAITLEDGGRRSPPVPLHRWKGQISLTGNGDVGGIMQYNATFTVHGRGHVQPLRSSVWDPAPPPFFIATWDNDSTFLSWTVSGEGTDGDFRFQYEGTGGPVKLIQNGIRLHSPGLHTDPTGSQVTVSVNGPPIRYRETVTDLRDGSVTVNDLERFVFTSRTVDLTTDWTVPATTYLEATGDGFQEVNWNAMPAEPPFDPDEAPR